MGRNKNNNNNGPEAARMASWAGSQFSLMSPTPVEPNHNNKKLLGFGGSSTKVLTMMESGLETIEHDDLKQGSLYIVKIRNVSVALFEGWDDDMCCFAVLRSDSTPMRWSEARQVFLTLGSRDNANITGYRYIPGDFDAYDAFDEAGNPPVHLWTRHLRVNVPINWFSIFEEARRKQRNWMNEQNEEEYHYYPVEEDQAPANNKRRNKKKQDAAAAAAAMNTPPETDKSSSRSGSGDEDAGEENASEDEQDHHTENEDEGDQEDAASTTSDTPKVATPAESPKTQKANATTTTAPIKNNRDHSHTPKKEQHVAAAATPTPQPYQQQQQQALAQPPPQQQQQQVVNKPINKSEIPVPSSPKYLNTPPASPINALPSNATAAAIQATRQQQQQSFEKNNNLFGSTDFAFPHNETQFSIQSSGFSDSVLSTSSSLGGINAAAQQQQQRAPADDTAPAKSKRRSVQGLFRK
ncbi:hypothetical protein RO3G_07549 [Lichtheimia corymbifera JMRC:FSU:9682]|uniref:Uncharacterized protein n=1 Tax=Lichtheimia corymbifera JMRC:FSU:9682 TaxID=1263082 RepID=A0A068S2L4_9FUNG|nr:hypothetical protein RO3G_07549 [Lichtheimia corymbifera JMRC:FSU:9682]